MRSDAIHRNLDHLKKCRPVRLLKTFYFYYTCLAYGGIFKVLEQYAILVYLSVMRFFSVFGSYFNLTKLDLDIFLGPDRIDPLTWSKFTFGGLYFSVSLPDLSDQKSSIY